MKNVLLGLIVVMSCVVAAWCEDAGFAVANHDSVTASLRDSPADGVTAQIDTLSSAAASTTGLPYQGISIVLALYVLVQTIVRITPTPKDDEITSSIGRFFNLLFNRTRIKGAEADTLTRNVENRVLTMLHQQDGKRIERLAAEAAGKAVSLAEAEGLNALSSSVTTVARNAVRNAVIGRSMRTRFGSALKKFFIRG